MKRERVMKTTQKIWAVLIPAALMIGSPLAVAQVNDFETIQLEQPEKVEKQSLASWHGKKVALRGRDVVSFSQDSGPVKGSKKFVAEWDNTQWRFSSEANRDAFKINPEKYIPEFGGWCPVALSQGELKVGRTNQFTRIEDKLYMNFNKRARERFATNPDDYILKAQVAW